LAGVAYSVGAAVLGLIATPIVLRYLGAERLGAFRSLNDWYGYVGLAQLGIGAGILPVLARAIATEDEITIQTTFQTTVRAYLRVMGPSLIAGAVLVSSIPILIPVAADHVGDLRLAAAIAVSGLLLLPLAPFKAFADASGRAYVVSLLLLVQTTITAITSVVAAMADWGVMGQALAVTAGILVFHAALAGECIRRHPALLEGFVWRERRQAVPIPVWRYGRVAWLLDVCGRLSLATDGVIVALLLGPAMVVPLFITQRVPILIQGQLQGVGNACWAMFAHLHASGQERVFERRLLEVTRIISVIGVAAIAPVIVFNRDFVSTWIGPGQFGGELLTVVAATNALLLGLFSFWTWCLFGTGAMTDLVPVTIGQAVVNLSASLTLTAMVGFPGPVLGTFVGYAVVSSWCLPRLLRRRFGISLRHLAAAALVPVALGVPYVVLMALLISPVASRGWTMLLGSMAGAGLGFLALSWTCLVRGEDRARYRAIVIDTVRRVTAWTPVAGRRG
jgi:O-antigen/teichoic acid export membrane protein